jgi:hypothetical protein
MSLQTLVNTEMMQWMRRVAQGSLPVTNVESWSGTVHR